MNPVLGEHGTLDHVCFEVEDIEKAAEQCRRTYGAGPFFLREDVTFDQLTGGDGEEVDWKHSLALGSAGPIRIELHTTVSLKPASVEEDLRQLPINHLGFAVESLDAAIDAVTAVGAREILRARNEAVYLAYLQVPDLGVVELVEQADPDFRARFVAALEAERAAYAGGPVLRVGMPPALAE